MTTHEAPPAYGEPTRSSPDAATWRAHAAVEADEPRASAVILTDTGLRIAEIMYRSEAFKRVCVFGVGMTDRYDAAAAIARAFMPVVAAEVEAAVQAERDRWTAVFHGGPDTACRTTWHDDEEYVEVPMSELRVLIAGDSKGGAL